MARLVKETVETRNRMGDLPSALRPREQALKVGIANVDDSALLAILLGGGFRGMNVLALASGLLTRYGSLTALAAASVEELQAINGLGPVKALKLKAALELARRLVHEEVAEPQSMRSPEEVARVLREEARGCTRECFWILMLDARNRLKAPPLRVTQGIVDASLVDPREVFKPAMEVKCRALVVAHNHPSGDPTPSSEDLRITRQLVEAGRILDIRVLDHLILGRRTENRDRDFLSLRESGMVSFET